MRINFSQIYFNFDFVNINFHPKYLLFLRGVRRATKRMEAVVEVGKQETLVQLWNHSSARHSCIKYNSSYLRRPNTCYKNLFIVVWRTLIRANGLNMWKGNISSNEFYSLWLNLLRNNASCKVWLNLRKITQCLNRQSHPDKIRVYIFDIIFYFSFQFLMWTICYSCYRDWHRQWLPLTESPFVLACKAYIIHILSVKNMRLN